MIAVSLSVGSAIGRSWIEMSFSSGYWWSYSDLVYAYEYFLVNGCPSLLYDVNVSSIAEGTVETSAVSDLDLVMRKNRLEQSEWIAGVQLVLMVIPRGFRFEKSSALGWPLDNHGNPAPFLTAFTVLPNDFPGIQYPLVGGFVGE